jgi:integrase
MAGRLTQRAVDSVKTPVKGQFFLRDSEIRGFALRVTANGARAFVWDGRVAGRMARITIGRCPDLSLDEAKARALAIRHEIAIGIDPRTKRAHENRQPTLRDLAGLYIEYHSRPRKKSWREDERLLKTYFQPLATLRASDCSREIISKWHQRLGADHGYYQANRCLALLSSIYGWAIRLGYWDGSNPVRAITRFREQHRERFLSTSEFARLQEALQGEPSVYWKTYFRLLLLTGARRTELLRARWEQINLIDALWTMPNTKAGRSHRLPLPLAAVRLLEGLPSRFESAWVFPSGKRRDQPLMNANTAWKRIRKRAGLPDVRIHDLRRTNGSWLAAQGASLPLIGRVLNHSNPSTTAIYARLDLQPIREALEVNAKLMFGENH